MSFTLKWGLSGPVNIDAVPHMNKPKLKAWNMIGIMLCWKVLCKCFVRNRYYYFKPIWLPGEWKTLLFSTAPWVRICKVDLEFGFGAGIGRSPTGVPVVGVKGRLGGRRRGEAKMDGPVRCWELGVRGDMAGKACCGSIWESKWGMSMFSWCNLAPFSISCKPWVGFLSKVASFPRNSQTSWERHWSSTGYRIEVWEILPRA